MLLLEMHRFLTVLRRAERIFAFPAMATQREHRWNLTRAETILVCTMLFSKTVTVGTGGAQLFNFVFTGIDQLDFFGAQTSSTGDPFNCGAFNSAQFTLDDATFNTSSSASPVPEPSAVSSLALAVFGLLATRRRTARELTGGLHAKGHALFQMKSSLFQT